MALKIASYSDHFMTKTGSRRGSGDNLSDGSGGGCNFLYRLRFYFEACIETAARRALQRARKSYDPARARIDEAMSTSLREIDSGLQSYATITDKFSDTWADLAYFIGSKLDFERLVRATKEAGMRQRTYYFDATPDARTRALVFGAKYKRMVRLSKGYSNKA